MADILESIERAFCVEFVDHRSAKQPARAPGSIHNWFLRQATKRQTFGRELSKTNVSRCLYG
jgi:hypothetical protein